MGEPSEARVRYELIAASLVLLAALITFATQPDVWGFLTKTFPLPNENENHLRKMIPDEMIETCEPSAKSPIVAIARLRCSDSTVEVVQYNLFDSKSAMYQYYETERVSEFELPGDNCQQQSRAEHPFYVNNLKAGRVMCWQNHLAGVSYIEWVVDDVDVYSYAWRDDLKWRELYDWWTSHSVLSAHD